MRKAQGGGGGGDGLEGLMNSLKLSGEEPRR